MSPYCLISNNCYAPLVAPGIYKFEIYEDSYVRFAERCGKHLKKGKYLIVADNFDQLQIRDFIPTYHYPD